MHAAIVELDALTDPVRPAAEDDHLAPLARPGLALGRGAVGEAGLVAAVEVGRARLELGGAGIDPLEDRLDAEGAALGRDRAFAETAEPGEATVREALRLQLEQRLPIVRQPVAPHPLLRRDQCPDLLEKPGIVATGAVDLIDREAGAEGLRDHPQPVRRRPSERRPDGLGRPLGIGRAVDLDLVQALEPGLERAQRLLQQLGEGPPDRHDLADRLHRGGQQRLGLGELLEGEARHLGDHVVDGRLEGGRRAAGDVVGDLVERVAHGEARGDLRDRKPGRLRGQRRGARDPRVHLDDHHPAVVRIDRELDVRAAGVDADLAQHRDRGVAHALIFLVGQRERRGDRDAVAGVHAHRVDVLDRADDDAVVGPVADHLHLELFPAEHQLLDQDLGDRRGVETGGHDLLVFLAVIGDAAAPAAERVARPDDRRQADPVQGIGGLGERAHRGAPWHLEADPRHRLAEQLAILGLGDCLAARTDQLDAVALEGAVLGERARHVERGLAAHGRQAGVRALAGDDLGDHLGRDRLDIGRIGQLRIGHDRGRVRVDQNHPIALGFQRLDGLGAGVVELAGLTDHDRSGADHQDRREVGALGHVRCARSAL